MSELAEFQLLLMKNHLTKLNKYKSIIPKNLPDGRIILDEKPELCNELTLAENFNKTEINSGKKQRKSESDMAMNLEWQHMFADMHITPPSPSNDSGTTTSSPQSGNNQIQPTPSSSLVEYSMPERNFMQERHSECRKEFDDLTKKVKTRFAILSSSRNYDPVSYYSPIPSGWKPSGTLVAHLHEHKGAVTKMTPLKPFGSLFASVSLDGTVRLWDCNKLDGHQSINRSRQVYSANTPLKSVAACDSGQSLAISGTDGSLMLLRIDPNSTKMALQQARHMSSSSTRSSCDYEDGEVIDMQPLDQMSQSVIIFATLYGSIIGWDTRMPDYAWKFKSDFRNGVITTFCVDPTSSWLAVGTSSGKHIFWDLRFRLPICEYYTFCSRLYKFI